MHLVLPSKLPPERFYERVARLYGLTRADTQFGWAALKKLVEMVLQGNFFAMRRVFSAIQDMQKGPAYLEHPGTIPKPDWVPVGYRRVDWVDRGRSPLAETVAQTADTEIKVAVG